MPRSRGVVSDDWSLNASRSTSCRSLVALAKTHVYVGLPPPIDRPRLVLAREPRAGEVPRQRRRVQAIAQSVGLPRYVGVIEARAQEDGRGVRQLVARQLALLELGRREDARAVELCAQGSAARVGRGPLDEEAHELVPSVQRRPLARRDPVAERLDLGIECVEEVSLAEVHPATPKATRGGVVATRVCAHARGAAR